MNAPVQLGRTYRCPVCGAEVLVIRAGSQALDPWCCNQPMEPRAALVAVYRCPVCGAEVAVLRGGGGTLELVCCTRAMERRESPVPEAA
ncbi:MAG: hypothetical protein Kow0092_20020 [Deferrisomatales bacterium]